MRTLRALLSVLCLLALLVPSLAVSFNVKYGDESCLSEYVSTDELVSGEFTTKPENSRIAVTVTDPTGSVVFSRPSTSEGKFAYTAPKDGEYRVCFSNTAEGNFQKSVTFKYQTGAKAKDYSEVAKKNNLKPLEVELRRLEDTVASIKDGMNHLYEREKEMRITNESTASRVWYCSVLSICVLIAVSYFQVTSLRSYFQRKKFNLKF